MTEEEKELAIEEAAEAVRLAQEALEKAEQALLALSTKFYLAINERGEKQLIAISAEIEPKVDPRRPHMIKYATLHEGPEGVEIFDGSEDWNEHFYVYPNDKTRRWYNGDNLCLYRASHSREALQDWLDNKSDEEYK